MDGTAEQSTWRAPARKSFAQLYRTPDALWAFSEHSISRLSIPEQTQRHWGTSLRGPHWPPPPLAQAIMLWISELDERSSRPTSTLPCYDFDIRGDYNLNAFAAARGFCAKIAPAPF
jgi:hypothetical protein